MGGSGGVRKFGLGVEGQVGLRVGLENGGGSLLGNE